MSGDPNTERIVIGQDEATQMTLKEQMRQLDASRQTHLTDIASVRSEMLALIEYRQTHLRLPKSRLVAVAHQTCPYTKKLFPNLFNAAINHSRMDLASFKENLTNMLDKLKKVQEGQMTQEECSEQILNRDLAKKYYKRTDGGDDPFAQ